MTKSKSATTEKATAPAKKKRRLKMLALQDLVHGNVFVPGGHVYWGNYGELPPEEVAVPADPNAPIGELRSMQPEFSKENPPPWTSTGWQVQEYRKQGSDETGEADDQDD